MNIIQQLKDPAAGPMVIAEIGANHDGDFEKAKRMVDRASSAGAQLVKFQLYTGDEMVSDPERVVKLGPPDKPYVKAVGQLFDDMALTPEELKEVFEHARILGLVAFATPFSEAGVDTLVRIGSELLKIAASDVVNHPLLRKAAASGLPVILSLGKCTLAEADEAITVLRDNGCKDLAILHCVSAYPSPMEQMNLRVIPTLANLYPDCVVGFSDHSLGITAPIAATALGARIVEKHVTENRDDDGPDHWYSLEFEPLGELVQAMKDVSVALGSGTKRILACEAHGREKAITSLFAARDLKEGDVIKREDVKITRPGRGLPPKYLETIIGLELKSDLTAGASINWSHFKSGS